MGIPTDPWNLTLIKIRHFRKIVLAIILQVIIELWFFEKFKQFVMKGKVESRQPLQILKFLWSVNVSDIKKIFSGSKPLHVVVPTGYTYFLLMQLSVSLLEFSSH